MGLYDWRDSYGNQADSSTPFVWGYLNPNGAVNENCMTIANSPAEWYDWHCQGYLLAADDKDMYAAICMEN